MLQKETTACVRVPVARQRQQVCSRDEIVILLYDRLWWKRLKKEGGKRQEEILLEGQKDEKNNRKVAADGVISAAEGNVLNESTWFSRYKPWFV